MRSETKNIPRHVAEPRVFEAALREAMTKIEILASRVGVIEAELGHERTSTSESLLHLEEELLQTQNILKDLNLNLRQTACLTRNQDRKSEAAFRELFAYLERVLSWQIQVVNRPRRPRMGAALRRVLFVGVLVLLVAAGGLILEGIARLI